MIKLIKMYWCKIRGHKLQDAGSCPYTGLSYKVCLNCGTMKSRKTE